MPYRFLDARPDGCDHARVDLDLGHVRSFLAVVDYGGYHRAAEALHLSQPAVSQHVRRLEGQVGGPLFARRGRGVEVSAHGERVAAEVRPILAAHDEALVALARDGTGAGPFVLGAIEHLVDPVLPELLGRVRAHYPRRAVHVRIDRSRPLVDRLHAGEVDAAVVMNPHDADEAVELGLVELQWWASEELARRPLPSPLPVVAYDPPCGLRDMALARLDEAGIDKVLVAESPHLSGIQASVRGGLGVALLAGGADGLRRITEGPLAVPMTTSLWLVSRSEHRELVEPLRAALSTARRAASLAAA